MGPGLEIRKGLRGYLYFWADSGHGAGSGMSVTLGWGLGGKQGWRCGRGEAPSTLTAFPRSSCSSEDPPRSKAGGNSGWIHYHRMPAS